MSKWRGIFTILLTLVIGVVAASAAQAASGNHDSVVPSDGEFFERASQTGENSLFQIYDRLLAAMIAGEVLPTDLLAAVTLYRQNSVAETGRQLSDTCFVWDGAQWVLSTRTTFSYGVYSIPEEIVEESWDGAQWNNIARQLFTLGVGDRTETIISQIWQGSAWVDEGRFEFQYNGEGQLIETVGEIWMDDAWENAIRNTFVYNTSDKLMQMLIEIWQGGIWVNQLRQTYTWLGEQPSQLLMEMWSGSAWVNLNMSNFTYDELGNETMAIHWIWQGSIWLESQSDASKYVSGFLVEVIHNFVFQFRVTRTQYTYDGSGHQVTSLDQLKVGESWVNQGRCVYVYETGTGVLTEETQTPALFEIGQNYPNPFNPSTVIRYSLAEPAQVEITVYNVLGRQVKILEDAARTAGTHEVYWDGTDRTGQTVASGIYFYRIRSATFVETRKMILMR